MNTAHRKPLPGTDLDYFDAREAIERSGVGAAGIAAIVAFVVMPIVVVLLALIAPFSGVKFGGINETYLPPDNDTRVAQEAYDSAFPESRTDPVKLVVTGADSTQPAALSGLRSRLRVLRSMPQTSASSPSVRSERR